MAPRHLPRVPAFPIVGEKSIVTLLGTGLSIPASIQDDCPLIGKMAPEINLPDHLGRRCSLHATIALGRPIILFFFPLAGSPHCTKESCMFRDALGLTPIFSELQAIVIGISQDPPIRSKRFVDEHHLGYRILHDENRETMEAYGVQRTWLGLIDQRCTFIIDPSGTVRAMAQGVFDADGHVLFAEKWLIRLEHELSQRSRTLLAYEEDKNRSLMADPSGKGLDGWTRFTYGENNSASSGGIDATPRHGAASMISKKGQSISPYAQGRTVNAPKLNNFNGTFERVPKSQGEAATLEPVSATANISTSSSSSTKSDKNIWKHWKSVFQQLSSADDKPPPLVLSRNWPSDEVNGHAGNGKAQSIRSSRKSFSGGSAPGLPRSRSSSRLKDLGKASLRRGSLAAASSTKDSVSNKHTHERSSSNDIPSVPPLFATLEAQNAALAANQKSASHTVDSENSDRDASTGGTDGSLSSHISTAQTSLMGTSSHGSLRYGSNNGTPALANGNQNYQLARPAVLSEVLMPGEVLDLQQGPLPAIIKPLESQIQSIDSNTRIPPAPLTKSTNRPVVRKPAPSHLFTNDVVAVENERSITTPPRPPRRSSRFAQIPTSTSSAASSIMTHAEPPSDVPQDEGEGTHDDEEYVRQNDDGVIQVLDQPTNQIEQPVNLQPAQSTLPRNGTKMNSNPSTPRMRGTPEDEGFSSSEMKPSRSSQQSLRAMRHRSASITDGIYRISTPTLSDAAEVNDDREIESSLSPRPRSNRTSENGAYVAGREARLRRPMAPPKDIPILTRQLSKSSLSDHSSNQHDGFSTSASPPGSDIGTVQRVVRKANLRSEQPIIVPSAKITANSIGDVPPRPAPPIPTIAFGARDGNNGMVNGIDQFGEPVSYSHHSTNASSISSFKGFTDPEEMRRPSVSSMGTFGRRGSDAVE
ncbi:hypothetical protein L7F22_009636 [Adiantum nelumboides]|nr:hypothetical protein [Adiantum nelumboides]